MHDPRHRVYWWISSDLAELLQDDPDLDGAFLFQRRRWAVPRHWGELLRSIRELRQHSFDWVIDLQGLARSGLVAWLAHGQLTVGVEDWREGAPAFYDWTVPRPSMTTHAVDWYLEVLRALQVPVHWNFNWIPLRTRVLDRVRSQAGTPDAAWVLVHPGARWVNKRWPVEHFAQVVGELGQAHPHLRFAILGSGADRSLGAIIQRSSPEQCLDLTGRTTLQEMVEWTRLSTLVITNDTGPMHVAAALRKPVVGLFGPTDPRRTGPYQQIEQALRIALPCAPCLTPRCHFSRPMECLRALAPAVVRARAELYLGLNNAAGPAVD